MRFISAFALVLAVSTAPALAVDFSRVRCDTADSIKFMEEQIAKAPVQGGGMGKSFLGHITKATTRQATTNKLICDVTVKAGGGVGDVKLTLTFTQFGNGKLTLDIKQR